VFSPPEDVWAHPSVAVGPSGIEGSGLFATADLTAGTVVLRLGGRLVSTVELDALIAAADADPGAAYVDSTTVDEDVHLVLPSRSTAHFANHSCDPNQWHDGPFEVVARRDIAAGEELTVDYATSAGAPGLRMVCACGAAACRGSVTSDDWRIPELQERYAGHWVPALAHRIAGLRA
jgi:SET domain-containing protein